MRRRSPAPRPRRRKAMSAELVPITGDMLRRRRRDAEELDPFERQLRADALLPRRADQCRQRRQAQARVRVPDRGARVDGDRADRRRRRHVPDDVVQPRLRDRRGDRRGILALQAQARADRDGLLRQQQPRRRDRRRQAVHGHDRRQARRARRQDRQAAVGDADRRSREGLLGNDGARGRRRQGADRHQRRRIRRARLRQGVQRRGRQAAVDVLYDPGEGSRRRVGGQRRDRPQHAPRHRGGKEDAGREGRRRSIRRSAAASG